MKRRDAESVMEVFRNTACVESARECTVRLNRRKCAHRCDRTRLSRESHGVRSKRAICGVPHAFAGSSKSCTGSACRKPIVDCLHGDAQKFSNDGIPRSSGC
jgi:hypothetical protein